MDIVSKKLKWKRRDTFAERSMKRLCEPRQRIADACQSTDATAEMELFIQVATRRCACRTLSAHRTSARVKPGGRPMRQPRKPMREH
jgi:hypothetical protein